MTAIYRTAAGAQAVAQRYNDDLSRWDIPAQRQVVATRAGETSVIVCGPADAPPVVALHGAGTNSTIWLADAAAWSRTRRLYLVDIVGEPGFSAPSRLPLDSDAHAAWLDDVLSAVGADRPAFVGASLGGWLALDYAIRRPHRVERLALRCPGGVGRQKYAAVIAAAFLVPLGERGRRLALRLAVGPNAELGTITEYMLLIHRHYLPRRDRLPVFTDDQLRSLTMPMHVTVGGRDRILDAHDTARRLERLVPHATVTLLPDLGHAITGDGAAIHRFLDDGARS
ncbi:alpha/beta fold hydrolase [Mycobacterium sp. CPCC 205372]|uniref:Alpha/beta fold hydrolase n=1 Tax=Mycobacterium hippophais TaxID=3016340 RepID=A0ABT4PYH7_9MYCO|nr:alpha/beta fold hydrolase [Mycobacterium hippophais]MCZ8381531.1 alpha/beta fold hydrolase [Mycobacterium hippophais]